MGPKPGLGLRPPKQSRPGDELPDDCKLYVGNLSPNMTDEALKAMMMPFGNVLHAVVLKDQVSCTWHGNVCAVCITAKIQLTRILVDEGWKL